MFEITTVNSTAQILLRDTLSVIPDIIGIGKATLIQYNSRHQKKRNENCKLQTDSYFLLTTLLASYRGTATEGDINTNQIKHKQNEENGKESGKIEGK